jgi:hypothetical protein
MSSRVLRFQQQPRKRTISLDTVAAVVAGQSFFTAMVSPESRLTRYTTPETPLPMMLASTMLRTTWSTEKITFWNGVNCHGHPSSLPPPAFESLLPPRPRHPLC